MKSDISQRVCHSVSSTNLETLLHLSHQEMKNAHLLPVVFGPNIGVWRSYEIKYKSVQCVSQSVHLVYPLYMNKFGNETMK